ncbi:membrane-spanning 4-domains subfamily A member 4D-like [Ptychodera flava]|uniref:membrane-spanning 4-domains subfamily A member 4D-like n=1 Tax=Ptychodera flava TaxID=63121 RepID=UPI00396A31E4
MEQQTANETRSDFSHRTVCRLGATQVVLGFLCVVFGIGILMQEGLDISLIAAPMWCGAIFFVTGLFGILAAKRKTSSMIISSLVMCVLTATLFYPILFGVMVATMVMEAYYSCSYKYRYGYGTFLCHNRFFRQSIEGVILFLGFINFIVAIVNSVYCCRAICCKSRNATPTVYYTAQSGGVPQQAPIATTQYGQQIIILPPSGPSSPPPYGPYNTQPMFVQLSAVPTAGTSATYGKEPGTCYGQDQVKGGQSDTNDTSPPAYTQRL